MKPRSRLVPTTPAEGTVDAADRAQDKGRVQLADRVVAAAAVKQHPDRYTTLFARARSEVGHAICLCRNDKVVRLVIRCRSGRYHLANWPAEGHQHIPGCPWYRSHSSVSGRSAYAEAITTIEDGTAIRLSAPLTVRGASASPSTTTGPADAAAGTSRRALGPLALLHYLWECAQLNTWHPQVERRTWRTCQALLDEQVRDCQVNKVPLADALWIVPAFRPEHADRINAAWDRFLAGLTATSRARRRGLVLGELRAATPTDYSVRLSLAHQKAPLYATPQLMDRVRRSYPSVFSEHTGQSLRPRVVLCLIERSPGGYAKVVDLAAMLTTQTYLPVDSSYEADMADSLVSAGRAFVKPLRYDGDGVFPDFVLVDDEPETYVEVWGVRGRESYETRRRAKQNFYRDTGRALLEWDVNDPLPELAR
ncbi:uncharacterized protein DUF1173 [Lentzea atacamensis]|uniref:Uncharacterized protein DUF1173 n=1 Tax=Lentzea atacamensis TaxID=531938 RepID=A0ABX9DYG9_9PSEU|nr:DUF1173 family protein [Lentzea atacamensis]RAS59545.1 uncharacterized protein DUF1173 [Lentzea atacamensis]